MRLRFSDGSEAEYFADSQYQPYMLYCGTAHDRQLRLSIAQAAREAGFTVRDVDGAFGTVIVDASTDQHSAMMALPGVTSFCLDDPCGCLSGFQCSLCNK